MSLVFVYSCQILKGLCVVRRTRDEALATRANILDAAEWCFLTHGVSRTTLSLIAARAECTRGAIYWHFSKPIDIFRAVLDRGRIPLLERLRAVSLVPPPMMPKLRQCLHQCLCDIQDNERVRNVLEILAFRYDFAGDTLLFRELQQYEAERMMILLRHIFADAKKAGELRDLCPASCASLVGFALVGAVRLYLMGPVEADSMQEARGALDLAFELVQADAYRCGFVG